MKKTRLDQIKDFVGNRENEIAYELVEKLAGILFGQDEPEGQKYSLSGNRANFYNISKALMYIFIDAGFSEEATKEIFTMFLSQINLEQKIIYIDKITVIPKVHHLPLFSGGVKGLIDAGIDTTTIYEIVLSILYFCGDQLKEETAELILSTLEKIIDDENEKNGTGSSVAKQISNDDALNFLREQKFKMKKMRENLKSKRVKLV